ncbi:MAG: hypothetical protein LBL91_02245, partial [Lachnospiraceae bacterium]|nr:hypothetical protein [Lachnospiraceae bacterium]
MLKKIVLVFFILITINTYVYSSTETVDTAQIINEQSQALDIPSFLNESESYIKSAFPDMDMSSMFNSAITGKIDNKTIWSSILNLFAKEIVSAIKLLAGILVIVVLHSIIKSISDGLENKGVS